MEKGQTVMGFQHMKPEDRKAAQSKGGKSSTARGFNDPETARRAAKKGGQATKKKRLDNDAREEQSE
jgi:general stress protein YciG